MKKSNNLLEKRRHGTVDFPCAIYKQSGSEGPLQVNHHWHTHMEIIHAAKGTYQVEINMEACRFQEETFVFVNSEEIHALAVSDAAYEESAVVFDWSLLESAGKDPGQSQLIEPLARGEKGLCRILSASEPAFEAVKQEYEKIIRIFDSSRGSLAGAEILRIKGALLNLVAEMEEQGLVVNRGKEEDYRIEYLKKILGHIRSHYAEKIRIPELAQLVGMNEQYFCRFFKKMLGGTPVEYINDYRIDKARERLLATGDSIMNVAMDCGFGHMGNFIQSFKKREGCTPSEYRLRFKKSK